MTSPAADRLLFSPEEVRVLGSLMEKHLTTPGQYPLTVNALTNACNQRSNREPVMTLSQGTVGNLVAGLGERGYLKIDYGSRARKFHHLANSTFELDRNQQAVMAVLMLRAPQTLNDVLRRTQRMVDFIDIEAVSQTVQGLLDRAPPLAVLVPKGKGQREDRYTHGLCGDVIDQPTDTKDSIGVSDQTDSTKDRIKQLEARIDELERQVARLIDSRNA